MNDDTETADPEKLQAIEGYKAERLVQKSYKLLRGTTPMSFTNVT